MAQPIDPFIALASQDGSGQTLEQLLQDAQRNALSKQYNMVLRFVIVETNGLKPFFDSGDITWSAVNYGVVIATETELVKLLEKFVKLGATVATGTPPPV